MPQKQALLQKSQFRKALSKSSNAKLKLEVKSAFEQVKPGLDMVEDRIRKSLNSDAKVLSDVSNYLLRLGGKRIRPVITLLTAMMFGMKKPNNALIDVAAGIELIHMATLLHDDIIDQAATRRGKESAVSKFGTKESLLSGDFLFVRAFGLCANLSDFVIKETELACVQLIEGEVLENPINLTHDYSLEEYINVVDKKTAALFSLSAAVGSHSAGGSDAEVQTMKLFGHYAGTAFQMIDDILDLTADEKTLGKPPGIDLKQKTPSLVNILWLASGDPNAQDFFSTENVSWEQTNNVMNYLKNSEIVAQAKEISADFALKAIKCLDSVSSPSVEKTIKRQLTAIVEYTLERCY